MNKFHHASARRLSFRPLLEDALQILKGPLHNPETKDFKKITSAMKNCCFFRDNFSSQVALNEFVELAKFYVGYEVHQYGTVVLHDKEYADKLCVILDGTMEKIFQKPYRKVEEQMKEKRRGESFSGFSMIPFKAKIHLPSIKSTRVSENFDTFGCPLKRGIISQINPCSDQAKKIQRPSSQQRTTSTEEDEASQVESLTAFEDLMKFIVDKKPEMERKYYAEEILRADQVMTLTTGDYFGESFCVPNHPRSKYMFAVSSPEAHLLTLTKEDYNEIIKQLEKRNSKKFEAFMKLFPSFEKEKIQRFAEHFSQKSFQADEVIYYQGAPSQDLYIVQSGEVQLLRKTAIGFREKVGSSLPISSVVKDQAFGEEFFLTMENRQESAVANVPNTTVFVLKASLIPEIDEEFDEIFLELKNRAEEKFQWREKKAQELFEKNENSPISSSDYFHQPSFSPTRDVKGLFNPRHSIQIPNRRSFLLEKSPIQPDSPNNLPSSPASLFLKKSSRKLSDGQPEQQTQKSELYKSKFRRTSVVSEISQITRPGEKANYVQATDISPGSDLKTINFRNDLYGKNSSPKRSERFEKSPVSCQLGSDTQQKPNTIWKKHTRKSKSYKILIIKRNLL